MIRAVQRLNYFSTINRKALKHVSAMKFGKHNGNNTIITSSRYVAVGCSINIMPTVY